ncbi:hypothetical protein ACFIQF_15075 [Comamonas sp. J-3]|uniref:hypothetical protein n=1 Tax=Comamonas trifloxystrobinivorans TaxID=3350256 RepID=UPI00372948B4
MTTSQPFDLPAAARRHACCGVHGDVYLRRHEAASLIRSLRGIDAIAEVLSVESDDPGKQDAVALGGFLRGGLIDAIAMLTACALEHVERDLERQAKAARS